MFQEKNSFQDFSPILDDQSRQSRKSPRFRLSNMSPEIQNVLDFDLGAPTNFCINYVSDFEAEKTSVDMLDSLQVSVKHEKAHHNGQSPSRKIRKTAAKSHCSRTSSKRHQQVSKKHPKLDDFHHDSATHFTLNSPCPDESRSFKTVTADPSTHEDEKGLRQVNWKQVTPIKGLTISLGDDRDSTINFTIRHRVDPVQSSKKMRSVSFVVRRLNPSTLKF